MTGQQIAVMRRMLGMARSEFGGLLGASESAVRRWEQVGDEPATLEPRFQEIAAILREELDRDPERVRAALADVRRQGIRALHVLLTLHYGA